jgi:hypothetical protein
MGISAKNIPQKWRRKSQHKNRTRIKIIMKLPTIEQIAAMAANIQTETTALGKVKMALLIWENAQEAIIEYELVDYYENQFKDDSSHGFVDGMSLSAFLKKVFPNSKPEDRMKRMRDYIKSRIDANHSRESPSLTESDIDNEVVRVLSLYRKNGVRNAVDEMHYLLQESYSQASIARKDKAIKAAKARAAKARAAKEEAAKGDKNSKVKKTIRTPKNATKTAQAKKKKP